MNKKKEEEINQLLKESFVYGYLEDEGITDIKYNGTSLRLKHNKKGVYLAPEQPTSEEVTSLIRKIADIQGKEFTDTEVILDIQIGYFRVNAVHSAGSPYGTTMAMRVTRPRKVVNNIREISNLEVEKLLQVLTKAELGMVISGKTGTGKTELQKMLVGDITNNTIVLIEDTMDSHLKALYPEKDIYSWLILDNDDRTKKITGSDYIQAGLRNDADWIIIQETRSPEVAYEMVQASLSGHTMLTTLHAPGATKIPSRILNLVKQKYPVDETLMGKDIVENLPIGIHMKYEENEKGEIERYISEIVEFIDFNTAGAVSNTIYQKKNEYVDGKYIKTEESYPLSEKSLKILKDKKVYHLLPELFKS